MSSDKNEVKTIKVKLLKPHQHADKKYDAGDDIEVSELDAKWLKKLNIAEDVKTSPVQSNAVKALEEK